MTVPFACLGLFTVRLAIIDVHACPEHKQREGLSELESKLKTRYNVELKGNFWILTLDGLFLSRLSAMIPDAEKKTKGILDMALKGSTFPAPEPDWTYFCHRENTTEELQQNVPGYPKLPKPVKKCLQYLKLPGKNLEKTKKVADYLVQVHDSCKEFPSWYALKIHQKLTHGRWEMTTRAQIMALPGEEPVIRPVLNKDVLRCKGWPWRSLNAYHAQKFAWELPPAQPFCAILCSLLMKDQK